MLLNIEITARNGIEPTVYDIEKNIMAIDRAISGKMLAMDFVLFIDTKSILLGLKSAMKKNKDIDVKQKYLCRDNLYAPRVDDGKDIKKNYDKR